MSCFCSDVFFIFIYAQFLFNITKAANDDNRRYGGDDLNLD